ncbi:MAG: 3-oxoacyl-[acyl-carrier-protein] reductase [Alphaproteobacteria bacterium]|nr:3-oxoacyl-[acyl-carrier-protein] reductase [Alphaproteobacteria bacterium]
MFDLTGRGALVTGASGGIGAAIATHLHGCGATVMLTGTRVDALEALAARLGERALVRAADLSDPTAADGLIADAEAQLPSYDILVNNAGLTRDTLLMRMKDADWDLVLQVNLTAGMRLARASLKGMMKRRAGRIVGIASIVGVTGNAGQTNYAASKAGMIGFTKALAQEVASRGITVNCVAPGFIVTPMTDALSADQKTALTSRIPLGRLGTPEDVAAAVTFLASAEAGWITGQTLNVNGGMAMP